MFPVWKIQVSWDVKQPVLDYLKSKFSNTTVRISDLLFPILLKCEDNIFCREYLDSKLRICCRYFWKGLYLLQCAFRWVPEPSSPTLICFHENVNRIWANEYLKKSPPFRTTHCKYCRSCVGRKPLFTDLTAADSVTCLSPVWEKDSKFFSHPGVLCCKKTCIHKTWCLFLQ